MELKRDELDKLILQCAKYIKKNHEENITQSHILEILMNNEASTIKELQGILKMRSGSLCEILSRMEKKRFIKKEKIDGKAKRLIVTKEGKGEYDRIIRIKNERPDYYTVLSEKEKKELFRLLKCLEKHWSSIAVTKNVTNETLVE